MTTEEEISAARERGPRRFRAGSQIAISPRFLTSPIRSDPIDGRINRGRATESSSSTTWPIRSRSIGRINCVPIDRFASWINYDSPVLPSSPSDTGLLLFRKLDDDVKFTDGEFYIGADFSPNRFPSLVIAFYPESSFSQISARLFYTEDRSYCRARHVITTRRVSKRRVMIFLEGFHFVQYRSNYAGFQLTMK